MEEATLYEYVCETPALGQTMVYGDEMFVSETTIVIKHNGCVTFASNDNWTVINNTKVNDNRTR
jgi:hypothetical protein